jgi:hypothetical protein
LNVAHAATDAPVYLTSMQKQIALDAMIKEIAEMPITPAIMSLGRSHVHFCAQFGAVEIRPGVDGSKPPRLANSERKVSAASGFGPRDAT